jgi:tRNA (adenine37-N6)-methyltransferase
MQIDPIGIVRSPITEQTDEGWGKVVSEIHLQPELSAGLRGLDSFSHLLVIFLMHQSMFNPANDLLRRPRGLQTLPEVGIFAQRAKHRPVPLGVTAVELVAIEDNIVRVRGLDAIDSTPVLDLKPYFPAFDRVESAAVPEWVEILMKGYF